MRRFLKMYKIEQKIFFRSPDVILFCLLMPLGIGIDLLKKVSISNYDGILIFFIREATTLWQNRIKRWSIS